MQITNNTTGSEDASSGELQHQDADGSRRQPSAVESVARVMILTEGSGLARSCGRGSTEPASPQPGELPFPHLMSQNL